MEEVNLSEVLREKIAGEFDRLSTLEPGTKEYEAAVDSIGKLYRLAIEETETCFYKGPNMEAEMDFKREQMKQQRIEKIIDYSLRGAGIILPLIFYNMWMKRGFEFETEGTYTSQTFKGLFNKFKPTKVD